MVIIKYTKNSYAIVLGLFLILALSVLSLPENFHTNYMRELASNWMAHDPGFSGATSPGKFIEKTRKNAGKILYGKTLQFDDRPHIERIDIDIKFEDMQLILKDRSRAVKDNILINPHKVPAKIRYKDKTIKAKVRLKGDLEDHWDTQKRMSFRIKLKGNNAIFGFKSFSIQKPRSRQHPYDQIYQSLRAKTGGLSSNHTYAHIFVNGVNWGVMNIEEHMSKELLEKRQFKDSLIVRFGNEKGWAYNRTVNKELRLSGQRMSNAFLNVKLYNSGKYLKETIHRKWFSYISKQRLAVDSTQLYDVNKFSQALLLSEVWNNRHSLGHSNTRYYFNPYTLKLEPITTDQGQFYRWSKGRGGKQFDPMNYKIYKEIVSSDEYESNLSKNLKLISNTVLSAKEEIDYYHSYFPVDEKVSFSVLKENLNTVLQSPNKYLPAGYKVKEKAFEKSINQKISKEQVANVPEHIHAKHYTNGRIEIFNVLLNKVKVLSINHKSKPSFTVNKEILAYTKGKYLPGIVLETPFVGIQDKKISILTELNGVQRSFEIPISLISDDLYNPLFDDNSKEFVFLNKVAQDSWELLPGKWLVEQAIKITGNLFIPPGVELLFSSDAYLMVNGAIKVSGTKEKKVILRAKNKTWKGIYIYEGSSESQLSHVIIKDTRSLEDGILKLTGGVTFYKSDVIFKDVYFDTTKAEDALNIVHSTFELNNVTISSTGSDAFDADFSKGLVKQSNFIDIGGDALDLSGSHILIKNTKIMNVVDKAFSIGEASEATIDGGLLDNIGVAFVSKDGSKATASNVVIGSYTLSTAMTYVKKSFYGFPSLILINCKVKGKAKYIRQKGTKLIVDGHLIEEQQINVKSLYNSGIMKK